MQIKLFEKLRRKFEYFGNNARDSVRVRENENIWMIWWAQRHHN